MKVLALVVLIALGCNSERDLPRMQLAYGFDRTVESAVVDQAVELVRRRVGPFGSVARRGDEIVVDCELKLSSEVGRMVLPSPVKLDLRIEDNESPYLEKLVKHAGRDARATELGLLVVNDLLDRHIKAKDNGRYVNVAWAEKHGCTGKREPGRGVFCIVTGKQLLAAYVHGDAELFVEPLDTTLAVPEGHELAFDHQTKTDWRTRLLVRDAFTLDGKSVRGTKTARVIVPGSSIAKELTLELTLTDEMLRTIAERGTGKRVLAAFGDKLREVTRSGNVVKLTADFEDISHMDYSFAFASLPAQLIRK